MLPLNNKLLILRLVWDLTIHDMTFMHGGTNTSQVAVNMSCSVFVLFHHHLPLLKPDSSGALGSSDVVILLHGFPTSSHDWNKVPSARAQQIIRAPKLLWDLLLCEPARVELRVFPHRSGSRSRSASIESLHWTSWGLASVTSQWVKYVWV